MIEYKIINKIVNFMDFIFYNQLSKELGVSPELLIRENWEMLILKELTEAKFGSFLVFKGGTALRLAYQSPRFSHDLGFDLVKKISYSQFSDWADKLVKKYPELKLKDAADKYFTYLFQFSVKDDNLINRFSIKLEISKRNLKKKSYYEPRLLTSPVTPIQVLINVVFLDQIQAEKKEAIKTRKQPRDLFDLWFISQLKKEPWVCPKHSFKQRELRQELNKYLPLKYLSVIEKL